jgi:hypothetical protein
MSASGGYGPAAVCAGIVGHANLLLGEGARAVLEAEISAGQGRFRGIRHSSAWDADANVAHMYAARPSGLLLDSTFRKGFACFAPLTVPKRGCEQHQGNRDGCYPNPHRVRGARAQDLCCDVSPPSVSTTMPGPDRVAEFTNSRTRAA